MTFSMMITVTLYIECSGNEVQFIICEIIKVHEHNYDKLHFSSTFLE